MKNRNDQNDVLERFIPIELDELIVDLADTGLLAEAQQQQFLIFSSAYSALYHAQSHKQLKVLKRAYLPFNPDRDTILTAPVNTIELLETFKNALFEVIGNANYEQLSEQALNQALNKVSPHGVTVSVDFDEFEDVFLYYRGTATRTEMYWNWKSLSLKKQPVEIKIYRRLFVLLQPRNKQQWIQYLINNKKMTFAKAEKKASATLNALGISGENQVLYLKLFKDIPRADLEMLFPNTRIQIRLFDKIKLGIMGGGGAAGGILATISKLSAAIDPMSALLAIGGLAGVLWRQVAKVFSQRAKYSAILTKNLYFYSLANNLSTLTYLADTAESEECKEALLAYFFLLAKGASSRDELDKTIENFILDKYRIPMDFEISDGLDKLQKANLLNSRDTLITAVPLSEALISVKQQWENIISRPA